MRCAHDLGLRSGDVAKLSMNDIDWRSGTITLRRTKCRREGVLPLPVDIGEAIVHLDQPPRCLVRSHAHRLSSRRSGRVPPAGHGAGHDPLAAPQRRRVAATSGPCGHCGCQRADLERAAGKRRHRPDRDGQSHRHDGGGDDAIELRRGCGQADVFPARSEGLNLRSTPGGLPVGRSHPLTRPKRRHQAANTPRKPSTEGTGNRAGSALLEDAAEVTRLIGEARAVDCLKSS